MRQVVDLTGRVFGMLEVVERSKIKTTGFARWICRCQCGNYMICTSGNLKSGNTTSCGHVNGNYSANAYNTLDELRAAEDGYTGIDCIFNTKDRSRFYCQALQTNKCAGKRCAFRKTAAEADESDEYARRRILSLREPARSYILDKYYGGDINNVIADPKGL